MRTLYDALGVQPDVDDETIRLAFRMLAKAWHPDSNPGDRWSEQRFKQVTAAYVTLRNPASRAAYDAGLRAARRRMRLRRNREIIYSVVAAIVAFTVLSGGIVVFRQLQAVTVSADASQIPERRWPTASYDQRTASSASVETEPPAPRHHDVAPPAVRPSVDPLPGETATPPQSPGPAEQAGSPATGTEAPGDSARLPPTRTGSAMPTNTTAVRASAGAAGSRADTATADTTRTFAVPGEPPRIDRSPDDGHDTSARRHWVAIRVWAASRSDGSSGYRMRLYTVEREQGGRVAERHRVVKHALDLR